MNRIYTIPARDVVPGMLLNVAILDFVPVLAATPCRARLLPDDTIVPAVTLGGSRFSITVVPEARVQVTLPGPSPRELLCSCQEQASPVWCRPWADWREHATDCPVHRLRLRLLPVGATWNAAAVIPGPEETGCWVVPCPSGAVTVWPYDVGNDFDDFDPTHKRLLRVAFCEPEAAL